MLLSSFQALRYSGRASARNRDDLEGFPSVNVHGTLSEIISLSAHKVKCDVRILPKAFTSRQHQTA
jgi:hypothetical protein